MVVPPTLFCHHAQMRHDHEPVAKQALRTLFRARRHQFVEAMTPAARHAAGSNLAMVAASLLGQAILPGSYAAVGAEIDPEAIELHFAEIAFPRITGDTIHFHRARRHALVPGPLRTAQPAADAPHAVPDLLLVPLLAVTRHGDRLGQGKGHYDRAIAALRQRGPIRTIGLAWDVQIADALPVDPWDVPLDYIATPTQLFDCARNR